MCIQAPNRDPDRSASRARRGAFTLIEVLVVIAIIALLVSIALPAMSKARQLAKQTREMSGQRQLMLAYTLYADEFKGKLLPGVLTMNMAGKLTVLDDTGRRVDTEPSRRYVWRLLPYLNYNYSVIFEDAPSLQAMRQSDQYRSYLLSLNPSFGLNARFVGGESVNGVTAFDRDILARYGQFYLTSFEQARSPTRQLVFCSSRGGLLADFATEVPGYHVVHSPRMLEPEWPEGAYDARAKGSVFGFVDPRHSGQAVTSMLDGHVEPLRLNDLRDMTRWSYQADTPEWVLTPKP